MSYTIMKVKDITILGVLETCTNINLILGANNTGKSTFNRELEDAVTNCVIQPKNKWITALTIEAENIKSKFDTLFPELATFTTFEQTREVINSKGKVSIFGGAEWNGNVFSEILSKADTLNEYTVNSAIIRDTSWSYYRFFNKTSTAIENCDTRLVGPFSTTITKINDPHTDMVHFFYSEGSLFQKISQHVKEVFDVDLLFDDLGQGKKDIRLKPIIAIPVSFINKEEEATFWEENSALLSDQGDGLKAYMKILYSLFNPAKDVVIIDEPEAFLHSPQRRALGKFIAENATGGKQLFISTHDSEFLRGVLTNTALGTQIIHLKNKKGSREYSINKVRTISPASQNYNELVLNSYFNKLTILCEAEDDRMIYHYAAQKYLPAETVDAYFIGQNGKGAVFSVFKELISLKIPVAVIADVDALYSKESSTIPGITTTDNALLVSVRTDLNALSAPAKLAFKQGGCSTLSDKTLETRAEQAITMLKKYNVFLCPIGEVESWIDTSPIPKRMVQLAKNEIDISVLSLKKTTLKNFIKEVVTKP